MLYPKWGGIICAFTWDLDTNEIPRYVEVE